MKRSEFFELKEQISNEGMLKLKIVSDSMEPLMPVGQFYKVAKLNDEIKRFDIVVFFRDDKLVAHYVWNKNTLRGVSYSTRSLKEPDKDEIPVNEADVLGLLVGQKIGFFRKLGLSLRYA